MNFIKLNHLIFRTIRFFIILVLCFIFYKVLLVYLLTRGYHIWTYIIIWIVSAYFILPHFNKFISRNYLPNYFIGRSFTGDGLLGDPINIAINGSEKELIKLFLSSGWSRAEKLTFKSAIKITIFSIFKKSYPNAPVSFLYLFHRKPSFVFEKEIDGNPRRRYHVRVWKTPDDWYLPGGSHVDWLCAATYDERVGISMFTG